MSDSYWAPADRALRIAIALIGHLGLCAVVIVGVYGVEKLIHWLWGTADPLLFDAMPLRWLFQAIDCVIISVFGIGCAVEAYKILRKG